VTKPAWKPLTFGMVVALAILALFRLAGHGFFVEGRTASTLHALGGAVVGFMLGWAVSRFCCGLRGVMLAALPGLFLMAAMTSHFGLALPNIDPRLDKGFGGLMLWLYGFWLVGGLFAGERECRL
jgi:hypothetical protein